jgi:ankyrin repeat protein
MSRLLELLDNEEPVDLAEARAILNADPSEVSARDALNNTALHMAASRGQKKLAQMLLDKGADVNSRGDFGKTPLHYAAKEREPELVRLLAQHGADMDRIDDFGMSSLYLALQGELDTPTTSSLLLELGARVDANAAVWLSSASEYRRRLSENPNLIAASPNPEWLLNDAVIKGDPELVRVLVEHGALINGSPQQPPLLSALIYPEIVRLLLEHGADVNVTDSSGRSILKKARQDGAPERVINLLREFGGGE